MKTLSTKICPNCSIDFKFESWNVKRVYCSRKCKDIHLSGNRVTKEDWVLKALKKHNNLYNYAVTDFENKVNGKISIECKKHGIFLQNPSQHLSGKGCKKCANERQFFTTTDFILKSKSVHGEIYNYDLTDYKSMKEHVIITCLKHGNFYQSPTQHVHHKAGCHICSQIYTVSKGEKDWLDSLKIPDTSGCRQVIMEVNNKKFKVDGFLKIQSMNI